MSIFEEIRDFFTGSLTVSRVAAIIAAATSFVQFTLPLCLAVVLIGLLNPSNSKHTAATWSVVSKNLQSTLWTLFLGSDAEARKHVSRRAYYFSWLCMFAGVCLFIAGFMTPLGLSQDIQEVISPSPSQFGYVPDLTAFGKSTPSRMDMPFSRVCGWDAFVACPGSEFDEPYQKVQMFNSTIPQSTVNVFSSGTIGSTVSSIFDIQWRQWFRRSNQYIDQGDSWIGADFRSSGTLILEDDYRLIEGLVVDTKNESVCFRNHTTPSKTPLGAQWDEDLLCAQPLTQCKNINLTYHFTLTTMKAAIRGYLQDDGGLVNLSPSPPERPQDVRNGSVQDLQYRAALAAWANNRETISVLTDYSKENKTDLPGTVLGQQFIFGAQDFQKFVVNDGIMISPINGYYVHGNDDTLLVYMQNQSMAGFGTISQSFENPASCCTAFLLPYYTLPRYSADTVPTSTDTACQGYLQNRTADPGAAYVNCGFLYGTPIRTDGIQSMNYDLGSKWSVPLYTCASSVKLSVKTVSFDYDGRGSLSGLKVQKINDKIYPSSASQPLWATERTDLIINDIDVAWGMVDAQFENLTSITTSRAPEFYVPPHNFQRVLYQLYDSFAGTQVFTAVWNTVYNVAARQREILYFGIPNYTGQIDVSLATKWKDLSGTAEGAAKVLNLIWTDLAASAVVGTKTGFAPSTPSSTPSEPASSNSQLDSDPRVLGSRSIKGFYTVIRYDDYRYLIPAFIVAFLWILSVVLTLGFFIFRVVTGHLLHQMMNQTAMGRAVTNVLFSDRYEPTILTKKWLEVAGGEYLDIPCPKKRLPYKPVGSSPSPQATPHYRGYQQQQQNQQYPISPIINYPMDQEMQPLHPQPYNPAAIDQDNGMFSSHLSPFPVSRGHSRDTSRDSSIDVNDARNPMSQQYDWFHLSSRDRP